jgi:hypothetical protein
MNAYTYKSPRFLAKLVTASFFIYVAGIVWMSIGLVKGIGYMNALESGEPFDQEGLAAWAESFDGIEWKLIAFQVAGIIAFCFWVHRVVSNVHAFGLPGESPGMAVGSFFIPILNLWRPYKAITETWIASDPNALPGGNGDHWTQSRTSAPPYYLAWWIIWLVARISAKGIERFAGSNPTPSEAASSMSALLGAVAIELVALGLMFAVVWNLTRRQEQRHANGIATATVFT